MSFPKTSIKSTKFKEKNYTAYIMEFENAVFGFFFEREEVKIGTIAAALPRVGVMSQTSAIIFGHKNMNLTRLLAERLSSKFNKIAFSSVFIHNEDDVHISKVLLELVKNLG
ncbi:MAG: hypothetical protein N3E48_01985 [Candidatus Bathyarchaeota archaeon]|nr:hypothetical protein [Candidatus Bathyarchaeota archaeon]